MQREPLPMWTVYDHPKDFPDVFVARKFNVDFSGAHPTDEIIASESLMALREVLVIKGLIPVDRAPDDDAKIIEVWL